MLKKSKKPVRHYDAGDYIDPASDPNMNPNRSGDENSPVKFGDVFTNQTTLDPSAAISGLKKFVTDNKAYLAGAGALASVYSGGSGADKKVGYQGVIPTLAASRSMIAAPPTRAQGYRPGAGGIDYGGDVSYKLAPGMDPYANLSGTSGSAADANLTTPGGTTPGGLTNLPANVATVVPPKVVTPPVVPPVVPPKDLGSKGYQAAITAGLTPAQYLNNINQWLIDNPRASKTQIDEAMKTFGVSQTDLQEALRTTNFSDFTKYGLTHGQGLQELNFKISDWVEKHPFATAQEIKEAMKAAGVNQEDIARGLNALSASAGKEAAVVGGMGLDQLYKNILDYKAAGHTPEEIAAALAATGLEQRDLNNAEKYAKEKGYVANPKSEAATYDYLGKTKAANTTAASNASTAVVQPPVVPPVVSPTGTETSAAAIPPVVPTAPVAPVKPTDTEIFKFLTDNPALSDEVIAAIMNDTGLKPEDIARATGAKVADVQSRYDAVTPTTPVASETAVAPTGIETLVAPVAPTRSVIEPEETVTAPTGIETLVAPPVVEQPAEEPADQPVEQSVASPPVEQSVTEQIQELISPATPAASTAEDNKDDIYQYFADPSTQAMLASGDVQSIAETMQALGWSPAEVAAATGADPDEVQAAYDAALGAETYYGYADGGMAKGRYLQGETDGMADKLPARIGNDQPAALSHGEFVIPADVVSHMGNGNSDAGAKKLYQMMDKIRMARTGNKKQGKKINPDKFMPGGLAQAYAAGGRIQHFEEGGAAKNYAAGISGVESNLSNWAGPYVTNMLGQGQALANMPYQAYKGQLSAGESPLQTSAFSNATSLQTPSSIGTAATEAGKIGTAAQALDYSPTTFTNQFTAPTASKATEFTNQYTAPGAYSPTTSAFDATQAQAYMNPYLQTSLNPQLDEARRQSQITQQQNDARMTQGGAFGGGRQAIMNAETQRNLGSNLASITGQGYNTAYGNAMSQFNADQQRKMQEAQFGSGQGMANAQLKAQFGLSAQQANEAARQFGAQQSMTGAQTSAQYGLAGQQAGEQSKQFGAGYGLQGLQTGLQAAQAQGALGVQQSQADINNLNAQLTAGGQQRGIESEGIAADKAQFEEARANPYKMVQYQQSLLQGLPLAAQNYQGISQSDLTKAAQGASTVNQLLKNLGLA